MRKNYRNISGKSGGRALSLAYAAVTVIVILVIVCIVELIVLATINSRVDDRPDDTTTPAADTSDSTSPVVTTTYNSAATSVTPTPKARLEETADYGQEYIDKIIFLGDSTTNGLRAYSMLKDGRDTKQVWSGAGSVPFLSLNSVIASTKILYPDTEEAITIPEAVGRKKPEYLVITLGIDWAVDEHIEKNFKSYYRKLLDAIIPASPDTKIILQSIYPLAASAGAKYPTLTNAKIDDCNLWVEQIAEEYGVKYLNTNEALKGSDGYLPESYQNGDGLHFNQTGYSAVLNYIRTHGYPQE